MIKDIRFGVANRKFYLEIFQYPFDSPEDPNGQGVGHDAQEPSEGGPDAHHSEEVEWGRRDQVKEAGGVHVQVMVSHVACKLSTINLLNSNRIP